MSVWSDFLWTPQFITWVVCLWTAGEFDHVVVYACQRQAEREGPGSDVMCVRQVL